MQAYRKTSELEGDNTAYLEALYEDYLADPNAVDPSWRAYFASLKTEGQEISHQAIQQAFIALAKHPQAVQGVSGPSQEDLFRSQGHLAADIDPLQIAERVPLSTLGLDASSPLAAIYCGTTGFEYMYIEDTARREWLRERIEAKAPLSGDCKKWLLQRLVAADGLEKYLGTKFPGQKRFSLEGGDGFIPLMDALIQRSGQEGVKEIAIGMAHRGRLNVLINIMGKAPKVLFAEFEGQHEDHLLAGDVKYHNGFSSDVAIGEAMVHLALAFNPSHLEIVSPVVEGSVRARQVRRGYRTEQVLAIQVHGDAAISGQGCVYEALNMARTTGFNNGGSIHVVINNQVGFTTGPRDSRSTRYCTDVAKMVGAPVFHVNGNDPEAIFRAAELAADYRRVFGLDVFIDLICYRRHGHNESDEPSGTQPLMYAAVKAMPVPAKVYADRLVAEKVIVEADYVALQQAYKKALDAGTSVVKLLPPEKNKRFLTDWQIFQNKPWRTTYATDVSTENLLKWAAALAKIPAEFNLQTQVAKALQDRIKMAAEEIPFNWGGAEILAYASLLAEGIPVRLSGEDSGRGTFSHRHAEVYDQVTGARYVPLNHLQEKQAEFTLINSVLSEEAVLGFEYGYAASCPEGLTLWEAQYGDFANGAQVVIDQFMCAAEEKWGRLCGLTLLLPHGQEGAGPEHSSARLERYLQLCANENMQVCVPTTPAQIYHLLRRQALRNYRKPLVIMSPKGLLRHPLVTSTLKELVTGTFQSVLPEQDALKPKEIKRVVLCQGRIYYDLVIKRRALELKNVALIRIEQLYPFPDQELAEILAPYAHVKEWVWCQEEPENQGAWSKLRDDFNALHLPCRYFGRTAFASPAVGYANVFKEEQEALVLRTLTI